MAAPKSIDLFDHVFSCLHGKSGLIKRSQSIVFIFSLSVYVFMILMKISDWLSMQQINIWKPIIKMICKKELCIYKFDLIFQYISFFSFKNILIVLNHDKMYLQQRITPPNFFSFCLLNSGANKSVTLGKYFSMIFFLSK